MNTTEQVLEYAKSVHLALKGEPLPQGVYKSDHPYEGHDSDLIQELVNGDLVKSQVRDEYDVRSPRHQHTCKGH